MADAIGVSDDAPDGETDGAAVPPGVAAGAALEEVDEAAGVTATGAPPLGTGLVGSVKKSTTPATTANPMTSEVAP